MSTNDPPNPSGPGISEETAEENTGGSLLPSDIFGLLPGVLQTFSNLFNEDLLKALKRFLKNPLAWIFGAIIPALLNVYQSALEWLIDTYLVLLGGDNLAGFDQSGTWGVGDILAFPLVLLQDAIDAGLPAVASPALEVHTWLLDAAATTGPFEPVFVVLVYAGEIIVLWEVTTSAVPAAFSSAGDLFNSIPVVGGLASAVFSGFTDFLSNLGD